MTQTDIPYSWTGRINIVKMTTQSKLQIQCNPCQITSGMFHRIRTKILQFEWKKDHEQPSITEKEIQRWRNQASDYTTDFRLYYKATAIITVWYWHKNIYFNTWIPLAKLLMELYIYICTHTHTYVCVYFLSPVFL